MNQIRIPQGGLNFDDTPELLPREDYSYAKNIVFGRTPGGESGSVENLLGTTALTGIDELDANSVAIGRYEDKDENASYVFFYNSTASKNCIVKVTKDDNTVDKVIASAFLNFQSTSKITGVAKVGDLLYFTDNYNEPRLIDVTRYTTTGPASEGEINMIRRGPLMPPPFVKYENNISGESISNRGLDNDDFQFAYQYVYLDGQESVLSPFSKLAMRNVDNEDYRRIRVYIPLANADVQWQNGTDYDIWLQNGSYVVGQVVRPYGNNEYYICLSSHTNSGVTFDTDLSNGLWKATDPRYDFNYISYFEDLPSNVDYINVCSRRGNYGSWSVVERVDVDSGKAYKNWVDFYNSTNGLSVRTSRTNSYDAIPRKAEALEIIKNRLFIGNLFEGYNTPDVTISASGSSITSGTSTDGVVYLKPYVIKVLYYKYDGTPFEHTRYTYYFDEIEATVNPTSSYGNKKLYFVEYEGNWIRIGDSVGNDPIFDGGVLVGYDDYTSGVANPFTNQFNDDDYDSEGDYVEYRAEPDPTIPETVPVQIIQALSYDDADYLKERTFPSRSSYKIGAFFGDGSGRKSGVVTNKNCEVIFRSEDYSQKNRIFWNISDITIPTWATHMGLAITKNLSKTWFTEGYTTRISYSQIGADDERDYYNTAADDRINVSVNIEGFVESGGGYDFLEGDRILIYDLAGSGNSYDLEILEQDGYWIHCEYKNVGTLASVTPWDINRFEIYTPSKTISDGEFYETGDYFPINNPGTTYANLAVSSGELEGDTVIESVKVYKHNASGALEYYDLGYRKAIADDTDDDDVFIWNANIGRPIVEDFIGERTLGNYFRWSSTIIENTLVNGLSEFAGDNISNVDSNNGTIRKLISATKSQSEGTILLAISEVASASIYISERPLSLSDGTDFITAIEEIVGQVNTQKQRFGTVNPESVLEENGDIFWYDHRNRCMVRYGMHSGIFPISEYKAVTYFEEQADLNDNTYVYTGYDPYYKILFVTFENASSADKYTIGYHTIRNRWVSLYTMQPETYFNDGKNIYTVIAGTIYVHTNTSRNYFYSANEDSVIEFSMNDDVVIPKNWLTVGVSVDNNLITLSSGYESIITDALDVAISNRNGQATTLVSTDFEVEDGVAYSDILKDANTSVSNPLIYGDDIVSETILLRVTFYSTSESRIYSVRAGFIPSRGHSL